MATTTTHREMHAASAPRRSSTPLGLVVAGVLGLVLQSSLPSCSFDLGSMLDSNKGCGAQLAESVHQGGSSSAERALNSAACKAKLGR